MTVAQPVQQPLPVAEPLEWLARRELLDVAHAFRTTGPAWHWSLCERVRFTAGLATPEPDAVQCSACDLVANGTPGEAFGR